MFGSIPDDAPLNELENPAPATVYQPCPAPKVEVMSDSDQKILEKWLFQDTSLLNAGIMMGLYSVMRLGEVCAGPYPPSARSRRHMRPGATEIYPGSHRRTRRKRRLLNGSAVEESTFRRLCRNC